MLRHLKYFAIGLITIMVVIVIMFAALWLLIVHIAWVGTGIVIILFVASCWSIGWVLSGDPIEFKGKNYG